MVERLPSSFPCVVFRAGLLLLAALLLLTAGCGKTQLSSPISPQYSQKSGSSVIQKARAQIGRPYKYGGSYPKTGFDCSGLIYWSYIQCGVSVPRIAKEQAKAGKAVKRNELKQGDIVVFRISGRNQVHTGLYSGNGKFIHSPSSGKKVREDSMGSEYWARRYVGGRRIL